MLEQYLKVTNAQQLIELGVVPKTSSEMVSLIAFERLKKLRDTILAQADANALGSWVPLFQPEYIPQGSRVEDPGLIQKIAEKGMKVIGKSKVDNVDIKGLHGIIVRLENANSQLGIDWGEEGRHLALNNLSGTLDAKTGLYCAPGDLVVIAPRDIPQKYVKRPFAVADEKLGHIVRFTEEYEGEAQYVDDRHSKGIRFPKGITATLMGYNSERQNLFLNFHSNLPDQGNRKKYVLSLNDKIYPLLHVSSLGPFEHRYLTSPAEKQITLLTPEIKAANPDAYALHYRRQYSLAPNHAPTQNGGNKQIIDHQEWEDVFVVCPSSLASTLADSVLGTHVRILQQ